MFGVTIKRRMLQAYFGSVPILTTNKTQRGIFDHQEIAGYVSGTAKQQRLLRNMIDDPFDCIDLHVCRALWKSWRPTSHLDDCIEQALLLRADRITVALKIGRRKMGGEGEPRLPSSSVH